jgi:hypothetical protein
MMKKGQSGLEMGFGSVIGILLMVAFIAAMALIVVLVMNTMTNPTGVGDVGHGGSSGGAGASGGFKSSITIGQHAVSYNLTMTAIDPHQAET